MSGGADTTRPGLIADTSVGACGQYLRTAGSLIRVREYAETQGTGCLLDA